ncbi:MAG: class I SAM-dependent methyltransferase [Candidatus Zixiibacteriota bacterium]
MKKEKEWWRDFFEKDFRPFFNILSPRDTIFQVRYIIRKLGLRPGNRVLDCPCGYGRVSIPLAQSRLKVTAVDITRSYLEELQETASGKKVKVETVLEDMRKLKFQNRFDAALNLGTSLGFFEDEKDNLMVLRRLYQALKPGGQIMLHLINRDWLITNFESRGWLQFGDAISLESREFDYARSANKVQWSFLKNGELQTHYVTLRVYSYHELIAILKKVGFVDITGTGSVNDEPIDRSRRWMWIVGRKPGRRV